MLPPSWKGEVQKAVEETIKTDADQRQTQQDNNAANITAALKAISDAQDRQTSHEDGSDKKNLALNVVTIILLFVTVFFTYKTWKTFEGQLEEMRKVYKPIEDQAKVAQETLIASSRGWIAPRAAQIAGRLEKGRPIDVVVHYENPGREPAQNVIHVINGNVIADPALLAPDKLATLQFPENRLCDVPTPSEGEGMIAFPSVQGYDVHLSIFSKEGTPQAVLEGNESFFIEGCFLYRTLGAVHHSSYCMYLDPNKTKPPEQWLFKFCINGNRAD